MRRILCRSMRSPTGSASQRGVQTRAAKLAGFQEREARVPQGFMLWIASWLAQSRSSSRSDARSAAGSVNRIVCMPAAAAAATLAGRSSMKTVASARSRTSRAGAQMRGSRLGRRRSPEMTMPSNQPRKSKRARAMGNVPPPSRGRRAARRARAARRGSPPPRRSSSNRSRQASMSGLASGNSRTSSAQPSANVARRPAVVPRRRADVREEVLHRRGVAAEERAIEIPRVPVDQDAAEIEDDDGRSRQVHRSMVTLVPKRDERIRARGPARRQLGGDEARRRRARRSPPPRQRIRRRDAEQQRSAPSRWRPTPPARRAPRRSRRAGRRPRTPAPGSAPRRAPSATGRPVPASVPSRRRRRPVEPDGGQQQRQQPEPGGEQREHALPNDRGADLRRQRLHLERRARHRGADGRLDRPRQRAALRRAAHEQLTAPVAGQLGVGEIDGVGRRLAEARCSACPGDADDRRLRAGPRTFAPGAARRRRAGEVPPRERLVHDRHRQAAGGHRRRRTAAPRRCGSPASRNSRPGADGERRVPVGHRLPGRHERLAPQRAAERRVRGQRRARTTPGSAPTSPATSRGAELREVELDEDDAVGVEPGVDLLEIARSVRMNRPAPASSTSASAICR